ncbi:hypothetical protein SAMN04490182_0087 [Pseudomonas cedrina]|uniref:Uncharacterized protein n=2 Tax=Pseudomonas cedrina TaxID=651740 RepID=A0A1V2KCF6_PSECE|nr:hypothetical protein [Pseudomonas cedrina]ONH55055.1 hypothetical protein BLL36_09105 [Pseudomonas cedrina subsp. cedrina]SDR83115.1 hypothetical protein SAMN04490182_0087 [Pseudomonas cedrina]
MATKIAAKFKSPNKNSTSNVDISELPNKGDHINQDGHLFVVTKKTFYSENDVVTGVEFELDPA